MWVTRHKLNNSLAIFIHGIFGNRWGTWKGIPAVVQENMRNDPLVRSYDMYLFGYDTSLFKQPALNPFVIDQLGDVIDQVSEKYHTIALIAHSQGGLVAKLYTLRELQENRGQSLKVDLIITLGTPHRGLLRLVPWLWMKNLPLVGRLVPCRQLAQLACVSSNIRTLKRHWTEEHIATSPCPAEPVCKYIRSVAAYGAYDFWVRNKSAWGFRVDMPKSTIESHRSLPKPISATGRVANLILQELRVNHDPRPIINEIRRIATDGAARTALAAAQSQWIVALVREQWPWLAAHELKQKAQSLVNDFLLCFPSRPLRGLPSVEANLRLFVERELSEDL